LKEVKGEGANGLLPDSEEKVRSRKIMNEKKAMQKPDAKKSGMPEIPFEKQKPLFGEMDRIVNVLEFELMDVSAEISRCLDTIARKKEEVEALKARAATIQSALADSKKLGKISAEESEKKKTGKTPDPKKNPDPGKPVAK
jgi:ACT domain-containing protein